MKLSPICNSTTNVSISSIAPHKVSEIFNSANPSNWSVWINEIVHTCCAHGIFCPNLPKMPLIKRQCFGKLKNWNTKKKTLRHHLLSPFICRPTWKSARSSEASTSPSYGRSRCQRSLEKWGLRWGHCWAIVVQHNPRRSSTSERRVGFVPHVE
jgi:hypothetical protein